MNKQQQTTLNMAKFIKSQSLTLLENWTHSMLMHRPPCEKLHELAEELQNSIQTRFESESGTG
ncbi:Regulatory protein rop [Escherichia coli]|nr:Rop family plasmid primer RNA-binding protein [Escherichia coli]VCV70385.1 Regulatory protein rop [Escherichia coli]